MVEDTDQVVFQQHLGFEVFMGAMEVRAEANHQNFMRLNPTNPYIVRWDAPKLAALKRLFPGFVSAAPAP